MARVLLIFALVATVFWVYTIVDCALQPPTRHRGVSKAAWLAIVIVFPVLGGILWFAVGRGRASAPTRMRAPDDDPEFLGSLGSQVDVDERIRRLEAELAKLDEEEPPEMPKPPPAPKLPDRPDDDDTRGQRGALG